MPAPPRPAPTDPCAAVLRRRGAVVRALRSVGRHVAAPLLTVASSLAASPAVAVEPCVGGQAGGFPCQRIDLLAQLTPPELGTSQVGDHWGWRDPLTGVDYALVVTFEGLAFVDLGDPERPLYLGTLPGPVFSGPGEVGPRPPGGRPLRHVRDVKVYADHSFLVADLPGNGLQIFDLTKLREVSEPPVVFGDTARYPGVSDAFNLAINEATGFAYAALDDLCDGGLHMVDVRQPLEPSFAGCFQDDGPTRDVQCVLYAGPDPDHQGREVCFAANIDTLTIVDVTDKSDPSILSRNPYVGAVTANQGWLTEDQATFLLGDVGDEIALGHGTKTYVWDVRDLDLPVVAGEHVAATRAIDHNQYVRGGLVYQANFAAGLRVLEIGDPAAGELAEIAFFDTQPESDEPAFDGAWGVYPFFDGDLVTVSDTIGGLFVLRSRAAAELFADGFESGDVSAWSSSVP